MLHCCSFLVHSSGDITSIFARKVPNCSITCWCHRIALWLCKIQRQQSLTLWYCLFLGWFNQHVMCIFSYYANQSSCFARWWQWSPLMVECVRLKIVHTLLTFIWLMGQQAWHVPFQVWCRPVHSLWMDMPMEISDCRMRKTSNNWRSVDSYIKHIQIAFLHSIIVCN